MNPDHSSWLAKATDIPKDRLAAHERGELILTENEIYPLSLFKRSHPLDLLPEEEADALLKSGRVTYRDLADFDELSDIQTEAGLYRVFCSPSVGDTLFDLATSERGDHENHGFVRIDCLSGVTHVLRHGTISSQHIRQDVAFPPPATFNPQFQLAITKDVDALGTEHPVTDAIRKTRSSLLVSMQRPIETGCMEVRLSNGKLIQCRLSTEWGYDPSAEVIHEIINQWGAGPNFIRLPTEPLDDENHRFFRITDISCLTIPTEHLIRHTEAR